MTSAATRNLPVVLSWWQGLPPAVRDRELDDFAMEFAFNSALIEGAELTFEEAREVFEEGTVTAYTGDVRSLVSLTNQKAAFAWMRRRVEEGAPLDEQLVLTLHRTLTYGTYSPTQLADGERPGTYRLSDYIVRETHDVGAPVDRCPRLTRELCAEVEAEMNDLDWPRALTCAAYLHNGFVTIHPFSEGSGRVARDLANLVLLRAGVPPVCFYEDEADRYYDALEAFDESGDLAPFKGLVADQVVRAWIDRVR